jgi:hypothetical protein
VTSRTSTLVSTARMALLHVSESDRYRAGTGAPLKHSPPCMISGSAAPYGFRSIAFSRRQRAIWHPLSGCAQRCSAPRMPRAHAHNFGTAPTRLPSGCHPDAPAMSVRPEPGSLPGCACRAETSEFAETNLRSASARARRTSGASAMRCPVRLAKANVAAGVAERVARSGRSCSYRSSARRVPARRDGWRLPFAWAERTRHRLAAYITAPRYHGTNSLCP